jgi:hypothetical protein
MIRFNTFTFSGSVQCFFAGQNTHVVEMCIKQKESIRVFIDSKARNTPRLSAASHPLEGFSGVSDSQKGPAEEQESRFLKQRRILRPPSRHPCPSQ